MTHWKRSWALTAATVFALAAVPAAIVTIPSSGVANADVCVSVGRRVSVSGCANVADAVAPYVPPPAYTLRCRTTHRRPRTSRDASATTAGGSTPPGAINPLTPHRVPTLVMSSTISHVSAKFCSIAASRRAYKHCAARWPPRGKAGDAGRSVRVVVDRLDAAAHEVGLVPEAISTDVR